MQWGGKVFHKDAEEDTTGTQVWAASILLARRVVELRSFFKGKRVLELGAGCGLPGIVAKAYTEASHVMLTDLFPLTLHNLKHNCELNFGTDKRNGSDNDGQINNGGEEDQGFEAAVDRETGYSARSEVSESGQQKNGELGETADSNAGDKLGEAFEAGKGEGTVEDNTGDGGGDGEAWAGVSVRAVDWTKPETWPEDKFDVILGSDLIYQKELVPCFVAMVRGVLKPGGAVLMTARGTERDGLPEFRAAMKKAGFKMDVTPVQPQYYTNPLVNEDQEECEQFFVLDPSHEYHFYAFRDEGAPGANSKNKKKAKRKKK
jgi:predicted nicotinamide N-methyase